MVNIVVGRDRLILDAAREHAIASGLGRITRDGIAKRAGVANGTINQAFTDMPGLVDALLLDAVEREDTELLVLGLAERHPVAIAAPDDLKARCAALLVG